MELLAKLREAVKERIAQRARAARAATRLKRQLLDALDERHKFELPPTLVDQEFDNVWQTVENDLKQQGRTFADEGTTEEEAKAEYRKIAERRVRLGLVIAEIGDKNQIKVTDEEVQRAVVERARQFPGQEQQVWEFYRNNPQALASLRAPIYEEKVVDFLLELAKVTEKKVAPRGALQAGRRRTRRPRSLRPDAAPLLRRRGESWNKPGQSPAAAGLLLRRAHP